MYHIYAQYFGQHTQTENIYTDMGNGSRQIGRNAQVNNTNYSNNTQETSIKHTYTARVDDELLRLLPVPFWLDDYML